MAHDLILNTYGTEYFHCSSLILKNCISLFFNLFIRISDLISISSPKSPSILSRYSKLRLKAFGLIIYNNLLFREKIEPDRWVNYGL